MKLMQLTSYSDKLLKGRRMKALLVCLMFLGTELFFRLAEATLYSLMLYFGELKPAGLFTGESPIQQAAALICTFLRYAAAAPLGFAAAYWFSELCSENRKKRRISLSHVLLNPRIYGRSLHMLLLSKALSAAFLAPAAFFGSTAYSFIKNGMDSSDSMHLLLAVHAAVMTVVSLILWIWSRLTMLAVPYLMIRFPEKSVFRLICGSFRFMKGRRATLLKIFLLYIPPMLFLVPIPYLLPKLFSAVSLFMSISLKEDEYLEGNTIHGDNRQTSYAPKLPAWTKRRFTPASDKAQAAGYGDNA